MPQDLKFVWPKDGPKGRGHRGFFGQLNNIMTGRGPDIFLQRKKSTQPITPDFWGNWDSYHLREYQQREESGPFVSRGLKRYDPHSRRYKTWTIPHDHHGLYSSWGIYPRFTVSESQKMAKAWRRGRLVDPEKMGSDWNHSGPKRFREEHNYFWQEQHRIGENIRQFFHPLADINPNFKMAQVHDTDVEDWIRTENLQNAWRYRRGYYYRR